jgi:predicted nucleic-acid-binding Zn-ribbon protein
MVKPQANNSGGGGGMWNFKKCPHCGGDTYIEEEIGGHYEKCLQCGYERELVMAKAGNARSTPVKKRSLSNN